MAAGGKGWRRSCWEQPRAGLSTKDKEISQGGRQETQAAGKEQTSKEALTMLRTSARFCRAGRASRGSLFFALAQRTLLALDSALGGRVHAAVVVSGAVRV